MIQPWRYERAVAHSSRFRQEPALNSVFINAIEWMRVGAL
jgi:hypothetical protein